MKFTPLLVSITLQYSHMKYFILIISSLLILQSCGDKKPATIEEIAEATPEALAPSSKYSESRGWGSSYGGRGNLVLKLYREAIDNDPELNTLDVSYKKVQKTIRDSTRVHRKYLSLIDDYWEDVASQLSNIKDSTRRKSSTENYELMQKEWQNKLTSHVKAIAALDSLDNLLEDEMTLLKIAISQPMMFNYHKNERPALSSYKNAMNAVEEQLLKTQNFLKKTNISVYE
jgi:hypothetical protein